MPERPDDRPLTSDHIDADAPEADALEQALPWGDQEDTDLPADLPDDAAEADALDQARTVPVPDDDEEPA